MWVSIINVKSRSSENKLEKKKLNLELIIMGLISDRRNKAKQSNNSKNEGSKMKKGLFGGSTSHMFPLATPSRTPGGMLPKYPPGYYTTPVNHSSSWSHPGQPKYQANVNPRYQTWVAPRKQPALGQLVMQSVHSSSEKNWGH